MKTKTKSQSKFLIVFATILCCVITINSFGQNPVVPTAQDFHGVWTGTDQNGNSIEIKLTPTWKCEFIINGVPVHSDNPVVGYRLPQYSQNAIDVNGAPTGSDVTIKFYTHNAMSGARVLASNSSAPANSSALEENNLIPQIYSGLAVISVDVDMHLHMDLYMDLNNFSATAPVVNFSPDNSILPFCTLVKQ